MSEQEHQRPNILIIQSDQHSPYVSGCYGDPLVQTPHLDRLAAGGVVFDRAYCPAPLCGPSRTAVLSGRHPHQNQAWTNEHMLDATLPTFAHALGAAGYSPTLIGRLHAIGPDQLRGFAERRVGDHFPNYMGGRPAARGPLGGTAGPDRISLRLSGPGQSAYELKDEDVTTATVNELNRLGEERRQNPSASPFCLSLGYMLPHQPFVARRKDYDLYDGRMTMPRIQEPFSDDLHPFIRWWRSECGIESVTDEEIMRSRTAYWALVTRLDAMLGCVFDALRDNGLAENTIIVYFTDHGEQVGEHSLWWKQTFYEASARIPAIVSWPGVLPAGTRSDRVISSHDLIATVLDAAGAPSIPGGVGRSLLPILTGRDEAWEDVAFAEHCTDEGWLCRMIRKDHWKLNYYHGYEPQLFNLRDDPDELNDLAGDPAHATVRRELTERVLDGWDPDEIARQMATLKERNQIWRDWARNIQPADQYRWEMRPDMSYLDDKAMMEAALS